MILPRQPSEKVSPVSHVLLHWVPAAAKAENFSLYKMQRLCIFLPGEAKVMGSKNFLLESTALLTGVISVLTFKLVCPSSFQPRVLLADPCQTQLFSLRGSSDASQPKLAC